MESALILKAHWLKLPFVTHIRLVKRNASLKVTYKIHRNRETKRDYVKEYRIQYRIEI